MFDGSATPLEYFQLFYSDVVFGKVADFTNVNARNKFDLAEGGGAGVMGLADVTFVRGKLSPWLS